jgi:hypothetical protein
MSNQFNMFHKRCLQISAGEGICGRRQKAEAQEFRSSGVQGSGVQEFRSSEAQECRSAGVQECRSAGVQEFRSSGVQEFRSSGVQEPRHR